jgi:hypothetical protein
MSNGHLIVTQGRKISQHRIFTVSPSYTAPNWFKVGTGTTTPAATDTALANAITIGGSATKAIASGYPTYDDTNMVITTRCIVLTTECNGNTITEFGLANNDGTPLLFSRAVFTGIAKTTSVQIIIVEKDKVS